MLISLSTVQFTATASTPFSGTAAAIPGTILAENFDKGGEGVAYHDTTPGNAGGAYRRTDVDLEPSTDGGNDVGWIAAGEWLKYSVNVAASDSYTVTFRVASLGQGGAFHLEVNGTNVSGSIVIPDTGDWQSWQSVTGTVALTAGLQVLRVVMDAGGPSGAVGNLNSMQFVGGGSASSTGLSPFGGSPVVVPGTIDAANFDNGGEGVAYHDTTAGNTGGAFRSTDVDLEASSEGGYDVGWIDAGEWLNYTVNVSAPGTYTAHLRVAALTGASLHIGFNGPSSVWTVVSVPGTGGWQAWTTVDVPVTLGQGVQQMTLLFDTPGMNIRSVTVGGSSGAPPPTSSGNTTTVPAGGDLQAAIDASQPGDTILLVPGATYTGIFTLPVKAGSDYVTIRSAAPDSSMPADGVRITPDYRAQLPLILGGIAGMPTIAATPGAHHYRLQFLEIASTYVWNNIIELGDGSASDVSLLPHDIVIDRCYIHGDPNNGQKRGIALNSASTSIVNSFISDIKSDQDDAQAIASWNGPGPFTIENNYLEAAGENVLFGGADPAIPNLVPSDISFRFNYVTKDVAWMGTSWTVKNLFEMKNAQRVVIDSNVFENNWAAAQSGYSIVLTPVNQGGTAPWSVVQQVQFTNNIVRHVSSGFNILGLNQGTYTITNAVTVRNNLFYDISANAWGGAGQLVLTQGGTNIVFDHNTVFTDGTSVVYADVTTVSGFVFTNNILPDNAWAVMGSNAGEGNGTLALYYPGATFLGNVIIGANASTYPAGDFFPADASAVGFVNLSGGDYRLSSTSLYLHSATDGTAVGCNIDALPK
jgi:hypothetical protein